jgi:hypothetical protein
MSEKLLAKAILKVVGREAGAEAGKSLRRIVDLIFERGNFERSDLLAEDLFGGA